MPYGNWNPKQIDQYRAIKRKKLSEGMPEDAAQEHAARIVNARKTVAKVLRKTR